jgi:hypothetical protein
MDKASDRAAAKAAILHAFQDTKNKGYLWSQLAENGGFSNIDPTHFDKVQARFESTIQLAAKTSTSEIKAKTQASGVSLATYNAYFLAIIMPSLQEFKHQAQHTAAGRKQQRQSQFDTALTNKQKEFDALFPERNQPKLDLSDPAVEGEDDTSAGFDMEKQLAKAMAEREHDLGLVPAPAPPKTPNHESYNQETQETQETQKKQEKQETQKKQEKQKENFIEKNKNEKRKTLENSEIKNNEKRETERMDHLERMLEQLLENQQKLLAALLAKEERVPDH